MNRRQFLIGCSAGASLLATSNLRLMAQPFLPSVNDSLFVLVFLRGGCDGLQLVAPTADRNFQDARPSGLKVGERGKFLKNAVADVGFRLHPKAAELQELYEEGHLAVLQACGLTNGTRSHFKAMELIERGIDKDQSVRDGWITRAFQQGNFTGKIPVVSASNEMAASMMGLRNAASIPNLNEFQLMEVIRHPSFIQKLYQGTTPLDQIAQQTLQTIGFVQQQLPKYGDGDAKPYRPRTGVRYPDHWRAAELSNSFQTLARLIKMDVGVQMANVDFGGWDTHEHQENYFPDLVQALSKSLYAFYQDLRDYHDRLTILVMSEFGRRLRANKSGGTDHGHGNMMMVLGGKVKGGRMYGKWPTLEANALDKGVDLAVTTDYRSVITEIMQHRFGLKDQQALFPKFTTKQKLGFMA
ncbi:MAG: DUF1501 domain-containing protein [Flammeovirgaceae bacterium]